MKLYTLGYSGWRVSDITAAAARLEAVVVDVRLSTSSRFQCFSGPALARVLAGRYKGAQGFGNLNFKAAHAPVALADYESGKATVDAILASGQSVILLCACKDLAVCHRKVVAEKLAADLGLDVEHLSPPSREPKMPLFGLV